MAALLLAQSLAGPAWSAAAPRAMPGIQADYEQGLFELAYSVFLANSSLSEALAVAERALDTQPGDITWRRRAAQVAEWDSRPERALTHWVQLANRDDQEARQSALRLSRALNEQPLRKQLLEQMLSRGTDDISLLKEYLQVSEGMGLPQEAYAMVTSGWVRGHDQYLLIEQARLAEQLGRPVAAIPVWIRLSTLRLLLPDESLKLAALWHGQGYPDQAWQTLLSGSQSAPPLATNFWRTFGNLAWARQELPEAVRASRMLMQQGTALEIDYQRLIIAAQANDPEQAYSVALSGWQRFHAPLYWQVLAETGLRIGRGQELVAFLKGLKPEEWKVLAENARSRLLMAQVHRQAGDTASSLANAKAALGLEPDNGEIASTYLWLLIDLQQTGELKRLVRDWEWRIVQLPELREPLAAALLLVGNPSRALQLYRILAPDRQDDPAWMASYGEVLEQAGYPETAWTARRRAQLLLARRLQATDDSPQNRRRDQLTKAQLLMHLAPGDTLRTAIQRVAGDQQDDFSRGLIMGWAMAAGQTDLARFWHWRCLAKTAQRLEWAELGLALEENDLTATADLIETALEKLPYRDAIEGARRSGQTLLAESLAFEQFQHNQRDHLLDKQVRDLFQTHPAGFRQRLTLQEQGGIGFLEEALSFSYPLTNRLALAAELNGTGIRHQKRGMLREYPSSIRSGLLSLQLRHEQGSAKLTAGLTDALSRFASFELTSDWRLYNRLVLELGLRSGWQAGESVPLRIAGLKDEAVLGLTTALTPRDSLSTRLTFRNLLDQERRPLGNGLSIEGEAVHKLLLDWPDTNLRFFSGYHDFSRNGAPAGKTLAMIPVGAADDFYVPRSFAQTGFGINIGQHFRNSYSRQWLPFGAADLSWNSVSGAGFRYELGLAGPLLGLDKLEGAFSQESGRFGSSDVNSRFDIRYLYNLN